MRTLLKLYELRATGERVQAKAGETSEGRAEVGLINGRLLHDGLREHAADDAHELRRGLPVALEAGLAARVRVCCAVTQQL